MRLQIDWASLIVGSKFYRFCVVLLLFEVNFSKCKPQGAYIWRGDLTEVFCVTGLGDLYLEGVIHGGAYFRKFTVRF